MSSLCIVRYPWSAVYFSLATVTGATSTNPSVITFVLMDSACRPRAGDSRLLSGPNVIIGRPRSTADQDPLPRPPCIPPFIDSRARVKGRHGQNLSGTGRGLTRDEAPYPPGARVRHHSLSLGRSTKVRASIGNNCVAPRKPLLQHGIIPW
jgi:hypothetical protein